MIEVFSDVAALPPDARALLAAAEREDFQLGPAWLATVAAEALPAGARPALLLWREAGTPAVLLALRCGPDQESAGLTSPYTSRFRPAVAAGIADAALRRAGAAFGRACRGGVLRLDALEADWPGWPPLLAGFRRAGMLPLRFAHFGSWELDLGGMDWQGYLASRPGELRETIRRRLARAERDTSVGFALVDGAEGLAEAIAAYDAVYAKSWKPPEPFPGFGPAMLRAAAAAGVLRLGVLRRAGEPVAAQYWTVSDGVATLHKLAHDEAARALSPGTVLTALMLRRLIGQERVRRIDLGRGDDAYKAGWTGTRRQRIGVLLCPPWRPAGLAALARHGLGRLAAVFANAQDGKA